MSSLKKGILLITLLSSVFVLNVPNVFAYVSTPILSGQFGNTLRGTWMANYAVMVRYDATGGGNDPFFFPGVESHSDDSNIVNKYWIWGLQIKVNGVKPDGSPISGLEFTNLACLDSPHDEGYSWYDVLSALYDVIKHLEPYGCTEFLKFGKPATVDMGNDATTVWARWEWNGWLSDLTADKGLQFRFSLHCDPDLPGLYTININYRVEICWQPPGCEGIYKCEEKNIYQTITYYFGGGGGGGGGCPYVSVWNGSQYMLDNNILPASEMSNGADVEDYYRLEQTLVPQNGKYRLLISEFEQEHSYIDQVKLLAVDHESDVNIAVTQEGEILTYRNPLAPLLCFDNNGTSRLSEISKMDGNVSDPTTYFEGYSGDYLILNFGKMESDNAKLILRTDMKKMDECILVQVKDSNGEWQTVEVLVPRTYWSIEAVNLTPYVSKNSDLLVRLFWKYHHRLDYVGLDTNKQDDYQIRYANIVSATHSIDGDVRALLIESDNLYTELVPDQQIQLTFTLPQNTKQARTYILYTKGHYTNLEG